MKNKILFLLTCFLTTTTHALEKNTQYWGSFSFIKPIQENWVVSAELKERYSVDKGQNVVRSARLGAGYKFESGLIYVLHFENRVTDNNNNNEKRFIHQLSKKIKFERVNVNLRLRQEQRKFEDSEVWMHRTRLQAKVEINALSNESITSYVSPEYFYISNTVASRQAGSAETRVQFGVNYKALDDLSLDLSYMDRRIYSEKTSVTPRNETLYQVILLSSKYEF